VGGWVGEKVAEFAGSRVGQGVRKGLTAVKNVAEKAWSAAKCVASSVMSKVGSVFSSVFSW
jgi:hypothetical protein